MTTPTRFARRGLFALAGVAPLAALAACSTDDDGNASGGSDAGGDGDSLLPPAEGTTQYPLTLTTPWTETTLEARPERIAAVGGSGQDAELLGMIAVTPVLAPSTIERAEWTLEAIPGEIEEVFPADAGSETPVEAIAAVEPDLIIGFGDFATDAEQLASVAPFLGVTSEDEIRDNDADTQLSAIGEALDLADAAGQALADNEAFFEDVAAENPEFEGLTVSYLVQYGEEYGLSYFSTPGSPPEDFFAQLGFTPNPLAENFADDPSVSDELISKIEADIVVIGCTVDEEDFDRLLGDKDLFQNLDAVQDGRYVTFFGAEGKNYEYDGEMHDGNLPWAVANSGPLGKQWAAERLIPMLRSAL